MIKDEVDGQYWTTMRDLWMRKDKEQCESWNLKNEVQTRNVLIFVCHLSHQFGHLLTTHSYQFSLFSVIVDCFSN